MFFYLANSFIQSHVQIEKVGSGGHCSSSLCRPWDLNQRPSAQWPKLQVIYPDAFAGYIIFAIGFADADYGELVNIASKPSDRHVFFVDDLDAFQKIEEELITLVCEAASASKHAALSGNRNVRETPRGPYSSPGFSICHSMDSEINMLPVRVY